MEEKSKSFLFGNKQNQTIKIATVFISIFGGVRFDYVGVFHRSICVDLC